MTPSSCAGSRNASSSIRVPPSPRSDDEAEIRRGLRRLRAEPDRWDQGSAWRIAPESVLAWRDMPTATRWRFNRAGVGQIGAVRVRALPLSPLPHRRHTRTSRRYRRRERPHRPRARQRSRRRRGGPADPARCGPCTRRPHHRRHRAVGADETKDRLGVLREGAGGQGQQACPWPVSRSERDWWRKVTHPIATAPTATMSIAATDRRGRVIGTGLARRPGPP